MKLAGQDTAVLLITEVIPKAQSLPIPTALLNIPGFSMYTNFNPQHHDLGSSGKRGVSIYIRNDLKASEVTLGETKFIEQCWIHLPLQSKDSLLIGCLYRSPSHATQEATEELCHLLNLACSSKYTHLLLCGDFNMPKIDWTNHFSSAPPSDPSHTFISALDDCFLTQHVCQPTRYRPGETPHTLDLIITSDEGMISNLQYESGLGKSDHIILTFQLNCYTFRHKFDTTQPNCFKGNPEKYVSLLSKVDWAAAESLSVNDQYCHMTTCLKNIAEVCFPRSNRKKDRKNIYINGQALKLKKKKEFLWRVYTRSHDIADYSRYTKCRNQLRALTRRLRSDLEHSLAKNIKHNPKAFWRYTNTRLRTKAKLDDLVDASGSTVSDDAGKACLLNSFFGSVFTKEDLNQIPEPTSQYMGTPIQTVRISAEAVRRKLETIKVDSAPGPDAVHPKLLQLASAPLSGPLAALFQKSLDQGVLPEAWTTAAVVPIHKKGNKQNPSNYRPISLTSIPCKILESLIRDELMEFLTVTDQLSKHQHGFRPRRSCSSQLLEVIEDWSKTIEHGDPVDVVYVDFQKAFDSVPHHRLLRKLHSYGISGNLLRWITAFLSGRKQEVVLNGYHSGLISVTSGVPQGSVLGPLLFIIYINDLPSAVSSSTKMFADDTKMYRNVASASGSTALQTDVDALAGWSDRWQLPFNVDKCKVLHIGANNVHHQYTMRGVTLASTETERDLGIHVDTALKFRKHAASAAAKANQILGVIRRSFELLNVITLPLLYKALVRPHLEFGNVAWGPFNRADQLLVERVQRRATRLIPTLRHLAYEERLEALELPSLFYRRRRGDMIQVYQIFHGGIDLHAEDFFSLAPSERTRGHPWKLQKPIAESRPRRQALSARAINDWNGLPIDVVCAATVAQFKAKLDFHWANIRYSVPT